MRRPIRRPMRRPCWPATCYNHGYNPSRPAGKQLLSARPLPGIVPGDRPALQGNPTATTSDNHAFDTEFYANGIREQDEYRLTIETSYPNVCTLAYRRRVRAGPGDLGLGARICPLDGRADYRWHERPRRPPARERDRPSTGRMPRGGSCTMPTGYAESRVCWGTLRPARRTTRCYDQLPPHCTRRGRAGLSPG